MGCGESLAIDTDPGLEHPSNKNTDAEFEAAVCQKEVAVLDAAEEYSHSQDSDSSRMESTKWEESCSPTLGRPLRVESYKHFVWSLKWCETNNITMISMFYDEYNNSCRAIAKHVCELAYRFNDILIVVADVDKVQRVSHMLRLTRLPTFIAFQNCKECLVHSRLTVADKKRLIDFISRYSLNECMKTCHISQLKAATPAALITKYSGTSASVGDIAGDDMAGKMSSKRSSEIISTDSGIVIPPTPVGS